MVVLLIIHKFKISKNRNIFFQFSFGIFPGFLPNIPECCCFNISLVYVVYPLLMCMRGE